MLSAAELHERGFAAMHSGRLHQARALLLKALDRSADGPQLGAIEVSLAYVEAETGHREEARRLCASVLERPGIDAETRASARSQLALFSMLAGRTADALSQYERAIGELTDWPLFLGRAHVNRGNLYLQQLDHVRAAADFAAAITALSDVAADSEVEMARHNLGYARHLAGDLAGALREMDRARVVLAPLSPVAEATCDQDRAEVLMAAGLATEAHRALANAATALGAARLRRRQGEAELALARALLLSDPVEADRVAARAGRRFARDDAAGWRLRAAAVRAVAGAATAYDDLEALAAELRREQLRPLALQVELAAVRRAVRAGDAEAAERRSSRVRLHRGDPLGVRLLAADVRAEVDQSLGRVTPALRRVRHGLDELHGWQSSFGSLDLQTNVVGHGTALGVRGLALAVESPSEAVLFEWSERARMLASRIQPVRAPRDPEAVADLAELRGGPAPEREAALRRRIRERAWQARGSGEVSEPLSLSGLRAALPGDTCVAAYVVTAERIVALVVSRSGARRFDLGARAALEPLLGGLLPDLDMAAADLPAALAESVRGALDARLAAVAEVLVAPLVDHLGERVVLTPSGVLAGVPWSLLPGLVGRPVTVAQSATSWLARRRTPLRTGSAGFVAGPRVARAEAEVRASSAAWPRAQVLAGAEATAAAAAELAGRVDVLHVAAHGRHASENPLFSGLELADGTWFGYDIDQLAAVPDVVLLSACELGRSSVRWGEELIGMTAAWLHAGARAVLASPAAVNDAVAHDVLVAVHRSLARGADPAEALAGAAPAPFLVFG